MKKHLQLSSSSSSFSVVPSVSSQRIFARARAHFGTAQTLVSSVFSTKMYNLQVCYYYYYNQSVMTVMTLSKSGVDESQTSVSTD